VVIVSQLYSNSQHLTTPALRVRAEIDSSVLEKPSTSSQVLPLTIEHGPPGVNRNYLLSSVLEPNSAFLGNYPHGLRLRHIHNLLLQPTSLTVKRCSSRKNINYVKSGFIGLSDSWGCYSVPISFEFKDGQDELTVELKTNKYWK
jgi:hypothetical protein